MPRHNIRDKEKVIWEFLRVNEKPLKAKILAGRLSISERMVRRLIRNLIAQGNLIASTMEPPYGYFIPKNEKEKRRYRSQLISRIRKIAKRLEDFDRIIARRIQRLLPLDIEEGAS